MADCTEAIRLDPHGTEAYRLRGIVYAWKGDFDRAVADLTEAIRLDPKSFQGFGGRADLYHKNGEFDKAIADYTESIRLIRNAPNISGVLRVPTERGASSTR